MLRIIVSQIESMKKIVSIFLLLLLIVAPLRSYAHTFPEATDSAKIDYFLPYPGMLPGSTLYPLKALRDRIIEFFISDPGKKAEFYILQADKRINAGVMLLEKGEGGLSETTVSKAEKYLERALNESERYKNKGRNVYWILGNIDKSIREHHEILHDLVDKSEGDLAKKYSQSLELNNKLLERVIKLRASE